MYFGSDVVVSWFRADAVRFKMDACMFAVCAEAAHPQKGRGKKKKKKTLREFETFQKGLLNEWG